MPVARLPNTALPKFSSTWPLVAVKSPPVDGGPGGIAYFFATLSQSSPSSSAFSAASASSRLPVRMNCTSRVSGVSYSVLCSS